MARKHHLPPSAASLTASMRDLGYSLETAVADIVDNSISADASTVRILCDLTAEVPVLAVVDDGFGMTEEQLIAAMKHGSTSPRTKRLAKDLGRFGLGLKTASFSQCRKLTVCSRKDGAIAAAEWDLDQIDDADDWLLSILEPQETAHLPFASELGTKGTLVLWRDLDRLSDDETGDRRDEIVNEKLSVLSRHLALVFHRFLSGEVKGRKKIRLSVNGAPVEAFDPFCRKNSATRLLPEEIVRIGPDVVSIQPYILPHHSRLRAAEYDFYQDRSDFLSNQGAYIYRGGRLMAWGDWFRLVPKGETTKLARVQIDFPNSLDESWTIDIKKSRARPPHAVRERLRQIIQKIAAGSTNVHRGRGQKLFDEIKAPMWERFADQGNIRFAVNQRHPVVEALLAGLPDSKATELQFLLEAISASLPVEMIYSDYSETPRDVRQTVISAAEIVDRLHLLMGTLFSVRTTKNPDVFREVVRSIRIFDTHHSTVEEFIRREF